jgi:hypothetical protein
MGKKRGRKTKDTPEMRRKILKLVAAGVPKKFACEASGIACSKFYEWLSKKRDLREELKKAEATNITGLLLKIKKAGEKHWTAYAWLLERLYPEIFGRVEQNTIQLRQAREKSEAAKMESAEERKSRAEEQREKFRRIFNIDTVRAEQVKERLATLGLEKPETNGHAPEQNGKAESNGNGHSEPA